MSPKFRGGSDDYLDDQKFRRNKSSLKKKKPTTAQALPWEEANATVAEVFPKLCRARLDDGTDRLCAYRRAQVFGHAGTEYRERSPVAVGDRVKVTSTGSKDGVIDGVCERRTRLLRPAPDREEKVVHVVVANIEILVIVAAAKDPEFSPGLVDRFLVAAQDQGIHPIICVNKTDLLAADAVKPWAYYSEIGFEVVEVSAKKGHQVSDLKEKLIGKSVAFCGHSGVGKTSLLRSLLGSEIGRVGEVSELTGKGRHTTTGAVLLEGQDGSRWIDTPGVREFGLLDIAPEALASYFPEFLNSHCGDPACLHFDEESCRVKQLPRYSSYRRIFESLRAGEH